MLQTNEGYKPLTEKYEPKCFDDFVGNEYVAGVLRMIAQLKQKTPTLVTGATGTGKTTLARLAAEGYLCPNYRFDSGRCGACSACQQIEQNMTDILGRGLFDEISAASWGDDKVIKRIEEWHHYGRGPLILDECDRMLKHQHRLLPLIKELRHPIIFTTVYADKLDPQLRGRCKQLSLRPVPNQAMRPHLLEIARKEGVEMSKQDVSGILTTLAQRGEKGLVRNALNELELFLAQRRWAEQTA